MPIEEDDAWYYSDHHHLTFVEATMGICIGIPDKHCQVYSQLHSPEEWRYQPWPWRMHVVPLPQWNATSSCCAVGHIWCNRRCLGSYWCHTGCFSCQSPSWVWTNVGSSAPRTRRDTISSLCKQSGKLNNCDNSSKVALYTLEWNKEFFIKDCNNLMNK